MAPCTFRFRNNPCPRQDQNTLTGAEVAAVASWKTTHRVNWATTGTPVCRPDYANIRSALAPAQPWDRHVAYNAGAWRGTVSEFPAVSVAAPTELSCTRALDSAIATAVYQLAAAGQPIPDPIGGG